MSRRRLRRARRKAEPGDRKVLAFYLPQFHQIPENDALVGSRFHRLGRTSNEPARSMTDHPQPVEPGELGRYDLSDPDVMRTPVPRWRPSTASTGS